MFPLSLGAHGLGPKTELFKTNISNFHCWTIVIGGIKHQKKKKKKKKTQKNTQNKFQTVDHSHIIQIHEKGEQMKWARQVSQLTPCGE